MTCEEKLEGLKKFLDENEVPYIENHVSGFGVTMELKIPKYWIAVHCGEADADEFFHKVRKRYSTFIIRESESMDFIIEKMELCIMNVLLRRQRHVDNLKRKEENIERERRKAEERKLHPKKKKKKKPKAHPKKKEPEKRVEEVPVKRKRQRIVRYEKI